MGQDAALKDSAVKGRRNTPIRHEREISRSSCSKEGKVTKVKKAHTKNPPPKKGKKGSQVCK